METKIVRQYITQDFSHEEKKSYLKYINGYKQSTDWIEKGNINLDLLLLLELNCSVCGQWVNFREDGICLCSTGHECYDVVLPAIKNLSNLSKL
jgi:hypothetical protein